MLDPQPTLSELDRKLGPVLGKQIDGIEDLRKLMSESEEDVSEPRREKKQRSGGETGGCAPATSTPRALWLHNALSDPVQLPVPLSRAGEEEQSTKLPRPPPSGKTFFCPDHTHLRRTHAIVFLFLCPPRSTAALPQVRRYAKLAGKVRIKENNSKKSK